MTHNRIIYTYLLNSLLVASVASAQVSTQPALDKDSLEFSYDEKTGKAEQNFSSGFERIFRNPALASGIASGSEAINRSIESLMDAIFYNLLDNELTYDITDHSQFVADLRRDLYPTPTGGYVVVDRVALGPQHNRVLTEVQKIPISLGIDGRVNVFDIYLRTDGQRLAEQEDLPFWRMAINNWLGILPFLSIVMPPSFNSNELYDPLRQLETPFVFPFGFDGFNSMPIGSIRSYSISGGINIPFGMQGLIANDIIKALRNAEGLKAGLPYSVFIRGEHRINVLRRSDNIAWVGVSNVKRFGHSLAANIGEKLFALQKVAAFWKGVPVPVMPLDIEVSQSQAWKYDTLYSFDLTNTRAREAYASAVFGNFAPAHECYLDQRERGIVTGVDFEFNRNESGRENSARNGPNLFVLRNSRETQRAKSEVTITDRDGKFEVLQAKQATIDEDWDVLVGGAESEFQELAELRVKKVLDTSDNTIPEDAAKAPTKYIFSADDRDPYKITLSLRIQDRYTDAAEYRRYLKDIRFFSKLEIATAPFIPLRDVSRVKQRQLALAASDPTKSIARVHVTPTYLGRFGATAAVVFTAEQIKEMVDASDSKQWAAFAQAYNIKPAYWRGSDSARRANMQMEWLGFMAAYPMRLLNMRFANIDAVREASNAISALQSLRGDNNPTSIWDKFHKLVATDHPLHLTRALLNLSNRKDTARSVTFSTSPKGKAPQAIKDAFGKLNNRVYKSFMPMPPPERSRIAEEKLQAFFPQDVHERRSQAIITKISLKPRMLPEEVILAREQALRSNDDLAISEVQKNRRLDRHVYLSLSAKNLDTSKPVRVYVRVEQAGLIQVGRFVLAEDVFRYQPISLPGSDVAGASVKTTDEMIEFYLTGPLSPLNNFFYEGAVESGGMYQVVMAISPDGQVWSGERTFRFRFEDGKVMAP